MIASWPTKSSSRRGRSERSKSSSGSSFGVLNPRRAVVADLAHRAHRGGLHATVIGEPSSARGRSDPRAARPRRRRAARRPRPGCSRARAARRGQGAWIVGGAGAGSGWSPAATGAVAPTFSRSSTMIRSAVRLPTPGAACRRAVSPAATALSSSRGGPPDSTASATFGPDRLDRDQHQEQLALLLGGESVQLQGVVADDHVAVQEHLVADRRHVPERLGRHRQPVADPAAVDHDVVAAADRDGAGDQGDHPARRRRPGPHRVPTSARTSGARFRSQIATASASAAWSGEGGPDNASSRATIRPTCSLPARPCPQTASLTCCGV